MAKSRKKLPEESIDSESYTFNDDATKDKIKKHIHDIKDVITEEDIANAKVPGEEGNFPESPKEDEEKKEEPHSEGKPVTPWDIVN
ncbi:hypothetical protein [Terrimonas pollutisoli]|uniref:hypothetical protein n=1 Tax=Terrimonas pollutisoli TaxID=3034147 RepID=UPI0023ED122A|nr:hypothetical protein [Terrimonas sp. H1YJ31]